jgi:hypothetical protein
MLRVAVSLVDGGLLDQTVPDSFYTELVALRASGLEGKALVHALLSDDWGAPPKFVTLSGTLSNGTAVKESIAYR